MLLTDACFLLYSLASLAVAMPGGTSDYAIPPKETTSYAAAPPVPPKETICTPIFVTKTSAGEQATTYVTTKTIVVPVTTINEKYTTITAPYLHTATGYSTKTVTDVETKLATKTYSTVSTFTTTIYNTKVESDLKTNTKFETSPFVSVSTSYSTSVGTIKETFISSKSTASVCTETTKVPFASTYVETKTACTTKGGYGDGY